MASKAEYVEVSRLIGRFLLPIGIMNLDDEDLAAVEVRRGLLLQFIEGLSNWYEQDNPRFSRDLFQKAVTDQAEASMTRFEEWCEKNGGIEYLDNLIEEGKELPPFMPPFDER